MSRKLITLIALAATATFAFAASSASAVYRSYEPAETGEPVKTRTSYKDDTTSKGCTVTLQNPDGSPGQGVIYPHGYSFSVKNKATGKTHTYTCNNGQWEETVSFTSPAGGDTYQADEAFVDASGTVVLVNPHQEYAYSNDGGYYAER